jgi:hypothetical protein
MRYRMLDVRIWCDEKFRSLTPIKPSGQALFLYLLSNPHTTSIPGLYRAGAGAMAEELSWSLIGFQRALKEVVGQGLVKADLKARVIFIPNAIKYNKPQSPNVVRSWAVHWDEIPECALKNEAYYSLESFIRGLGKAFTLAFAETLQQRGIKDFNKSRTKSCFNQEQEQEQEQEKEQKQEQNEKEAKLDEHSDESTVQLRSAHEAHTTNLSINSSTEFILTIPLHDNAVYQVTQQAYEEWQTIYTEVDVFQELRKLVVWNVAHPDKRKQRASISRHIHAWLTRAQQQKLQFSASPRSFPITFDHNLQIAKKWLAPTLETDIKPDKQRDFQLIKGKKIL